MKTGLPGEENVQGAISRVQSDWPYLDNIVTDLLIAIYYSAVGDMRTGAPYFGRAASLLRTREPGQLEPGQLKDATEANRFLFAYWTSVVMEGCVYDS